MIESPVHVTADWIFAYAEDVPWDMWRPSQFRSAAGFNRELRIREELTAWVAFVQQDRRIERTPAGSYVSGGSRMVADTWALLRYLGTQSGLRGLPPRPEGDLLDDGSEFFRRRDLVKHLDSLSDWCTSAPESGQRPASSRWAWATYDDAAAVLGVSLPRITQLRCEGKLEVQGDGKAAMVEPCSLFRLKAERDLREARGEQLKTPSTAAVLRRRDLGPTKR